MLPLRVERKPKREPIFYRKWWEKFWDIACYYELIGDETDSMRAANLSSYMFSHYLWYVENNLIF